MTRITFYILKGSRQDGLRTLCRVADKATQRGHQVFVHAPVPGVRDRFDEMLWTFDDRSFVAHESSQPGARHDVPVLIGDGEPPEGYYDILMNLGDEVPPGFSRCQRVIELVAGDEPERHAARVRWKHYKDRGYPLESHEL